MNLCKRVMVILAAVTTPFVFAVGTAPAAETYQVDGVHTSVIFRVKHLDVSYFYGRFTDVSGTYTLDDADPGNNSIDVTIKTESINTHSSKRDAHLKSPDFFNARQFPEITFKSTAIKDAGDEQWEVTGDFTLHGVTKSITVKMDHTGAGKDPWGGYRTGVETVFTIQRSDYGMDFMLNGLGDEIRIIVSLEGTRN